MSYLPVNTRTLSRSVARIGGARQGTRDSGALAVRVRRMVIIGLLVLAADWGSKAAMLRISPSSTIPHYTHPNVLALLLVLAAAPLVLRVINTRLMMVALGVCIGGCAGNLFERLGGVPVTDFIPVPHFLASPACQPGHTCGLVCNLADIALWSSVPLLLLAFLWHVLDRVSARHSAAA